MSKIEEISAAVETGKLKIIAGLVEEAMAEGNLAEDILRGMIEALGTVGAKFQSGEIYIPEMLVAARTMKKGVEVLTPALRSSGVEPIGRLIIGTVQGDLHDIGKNLVSLMIEGAGFEVIDLGVEVSAAKFIEALKENPDVKIVGLSALLTTTMPAMRETVKAIKASGLPGDVKIIVGGAPVTQNFADEIGADGYSEDAASAAVLAKSLVA